MNRTLLLSLVLATSSLLGCGSSAVGQACTRNDDCHTGQTCLTSAPEGYCTKPCTQEGEQLECPGDSVCAPHTNALVCSTPCERQEDCREGYECTGIANPSTRVCRPRAS